MKRFFLFLLLCGIFLTTCGPPMFVEQPLESSILNNDLNKAALEESISLGTDFILAHQKPEGNFDYEYDFATQSYAENDHQVRQAGALWGLALIHAYAPSEELSQAIQMSLSFFKIHSQQNQSGFFIVYPNAKEGDTGTIALLCLSLTDYLRTPDINHSLAKDLEVDLQAYLDFLLSLRKKDGQFYSSYNFETGQPNDDPSPYYDGEALLALIKAAKYANRQDLAELAQESAKAMYEAYVETTLAEGLDSKDTKGFYQWGSMAFYELYTSEWSRDEYAEWTLAMADWMLDTHHVLERTKNTGYAYEGLIHAWELARLTKDKDAMKKLSAAIEQGLSTLMQWQINPEDSLDPFALGGVRNEADGTTLRIDVTQHQMHATLLALKFLFSQ